MIEASGDMANPGRSIDDNFESSITFEIAQALKNELLQHSPTLKIILNRTANQTVAPLQNANFANKLDVDLYMSIHAFAETETKPRIYFYQFSYRDNFMIKDAELSFYPFDKVYVLNQNKTNAWAQQLKQLFENDPAWAIKGVFALPYKPLIGIKASSIGIEIGLKNKSEWRNALATMVNGIMHIVNNR